MALTTVLEIKNIYAGYNKREVLHDVSIMIPQSTITSLIGPNGAGKTTILKVIAGLLVAKKGTVYLSSRNITHLQIHQRINLGIGYFLQGGEVYGSSTCEDNLNVAAGSMKRQEVGKRVEEIYELFPELHDKRKKRAGLLSGGEKQMLALGIILMTKPMVMLLDEPSAGLAPIYLKNLFEKIKEINKKHGVSILLVEQNVKKAIKVSNKVYLMREGRIIEEENDPESLLSGSKINRLFLGKEV